jgi:hypothetical protein
VAGDSTRPRREFDPAPAPLLTGAARLTRFLGMPTLTAHEGQGQVVYRLYHSDRGPSFDSDFALGKHPRGPQIRSALIQMGLSFWITEAATREKNAAFDGRLGDSIVEVELVARQGLWWAYTFALDHVTVWGRPDTLSRCIRSNIPV